MDHSQNYQMRVTLFLCLFLLAPMQAHPKAAATQGAQLIAPAVVTALANDDLREAARLLKAQPSSPKSLYLLSQIELLFATNTTPRDRYYEAVACHNLVMFLQRHHRQNPKLSKAAHYGYAELAVKQRKLSRQASRDLPEKALLLDAALYASEGNMDEARRRFAGVDKAVVDRWSGYGGHFEGLETLAVWWAANGDPGRAVDILWIMAHTDASGLHYIFQVTDDFWMIEDDVGYEEIVATMHSGARPRRGGAQTVDGRLAPLASFPKLSGANGLHVRPDIVGAIAADQLKDLDRRLEKLAARGELTDKERYLRYLVKVALGIVMDDRPGGFDTGAELRPDDPLLDLRHGMAFHRLLLFLQSRDQTQPRYASEAMKLYKSAERNDALGALSRVLQAALLASIGDGLEAKTLFDGIRQMPTDFWTRVSVALYQASSGQTDKALTALTAAGQIDDHILVHWVQISDDFWKIKSNPKFEVLYDQWKHSCYRQWGTADQ